MKKQLFLGKIIHSKEGDFVVALAGRYHKRGKINRKMLGDYKYHQHYLFVFSHNDLHILSVVKDDEVNDVKKELGEPILVD